LAASDSEASVRSASGSSSIASAVPVITETAAMVQNGSRLDSFMLLRMSITSLSIICALLLFTMSPLLYRSWITPNGFHLLPLRGSRKFSTSTLYPAAAREAAVLRCSSPFGPWYADDPGSPKSCCQLASCTTEFSCQGLELDSPLVAWGSDFIMKGGRWQNMAGAGRGIHDPQRIRLNSYRVLLTRGREGMMIFVPNERVMDETFEFLVSCGCKAPRS
jgi:hypothetical protein